MRDLIWEHLVACINEYENNGVNYEFIEKKHMRFINKLNISGKKKYKTITIMRNYIQCPDEKMAQVVFANTLNNLSIGSTLLAQYSPVSG